MNITKLEQFLEPHIRTLGLSWDIDYRQNPQGETCQIISDEVRRKHEIILTSPALRNLQGFFSDIVHELCHGKLSEKYSPAFSTILFDEDTNQKYKSKSASKRKKTSERIHQLHMSWVHVDLWVNQLRHAHWPECTAEEATMINRNLPAVAQHPSFVPDPKTINVMAMHLADGARYGFETEAITDAIDNLPNPKKQLVHLLEEHYSGVPDLPEEAPQALKVLEDSVKKVAQLFGYSIQPSLIVERGQHVWSFTQKSKKRNKKK